MPKALRAADAMRLTDIPNIGRAIAADLQELGIRSPLDVRDMNPRAVYEALRVPMGKRHDPCLLDVLLAAHDFMHGGAAQPWWAFTARRKAMLATDKKTV